MRPLWPLIILGLLFSCTNTQIDRQIASINSENLDCRYLLAQIVREGPTTAEIDALGIIKDDGWKDGKLAVSQISYDRLTPLSGRRHDSVEDALKTRKIRKRKELGGGINSTSLVTFDNGMKAVWKPHQEVWSSNYRAEVLAYELDRKFRFNLVPPTVERKIDNQKGSLQLFVESVNNFNHTTEKDINKQSLLDFIIQNNDRHYNNYLIRPNGRVSSIDNGLSFSGKGFNGRSFEEREVEIKAFLSTAEGSEMIERFKNLEIDGFSREIKAYLGAKDTQTLIERIKFIIKYYKENIP